MSFCVHAHFFRYTETEVTRSLNIVREWGGVLLPGHSRKDLKVAVLIQRNFRNRLEREVAELKLITKLKTMERPGLNRGIGLLSHYT